MERNAELGVFSGSQEDDMKKSLILLFVCIFTITLFSLKDVHACMCGPRPSVLDELERADHVIIAKVTAFKVEDDSKKQYSNARDLVNALMDGVNPSGESAVMTVVKVYKGGLNPGENIEFIQAVTNCDYEFSKKSVGMEFFLYLSNPRGTPPRYAFSGCGRSTLVENAFEDIRYFENPPDVKGKTRISGVLKKTDDSSPLGGQKILIYQGDKTWETVTDSNGVYEIYGLPAGKYEIEPKLPENWKIDTYLMHNYELERITGLNPIASANPGKRLSVVLSDGKHASKDIYIIPDSAVRGRLVSASGSPLANELLKVERIDEESRLHTLRTDKNGNFDISFTAAGKYVLCFDSITVTDDIPVGGKIYYPGGVNKDEAKVFSITPGAIFSDLVFRIPKSKGLLKISAIVVDPNGRKVNNPAKTSLQFKSETGEMRLYADSLENGVFRINISKGVSGKLFYIWDVSTGVFRSCPEKTDMSKRYTSINSKELWISGKEDDDVMDVHLQLPNPCE